MSSCCGASRRWQGVGAGPRLPRSRGLPRESRLRARRPCGEGLPPASWEVQNEDVRWVCAADAADAAGGGWAETKQSDADRPMWVHVRISHKIRFARTEASLRGRMSVFERSSGSWMEGGSTWALASPAAGLARNRPRRRLEKLQVCEKLYTVPQNCWKSGGQSCARAGELRAILYSSVARNSARGAA